MAPDVLTRYYRDSGRGIEDSEIYYAQDDRWVMVSPHGVVTQSPTVTPLSFPEGFAEVPAGEAERQLVERAGRIAEAMRDPPPPIDEPTIMMALAGPLGPLIFDLATWIRHRRAERRSAQEQKTVE
jgi:hypothetical protein